MRRMKNMTGYFWIIRDSVLPKKQWGSFSNLLRLHI